MTSCARHAGRGLTVDPALAAAAAKKIPDKNADQNSNKVTLPSREIFAMNGGCCCPTVRRIFGSALRKISASISARKLPCPLEQTREPSLAGLPVSLRRDNGCVRHA
jgi:hypothetical protein